MVEPKAVFWWLQNIKLKAQIFVWLKKTRWYRHIGLLSCHNFSNLTCQTEQFLNQLHLFYLSMQRQAQTNCLERGPLYHHPKRPSVFHGGLIAFLLQAEPGGNSSNLLHLSTFKHLRKSIEQWLRTYITTKGKLISYWTLGNLTCPDASQGFSHS